MEQTIVKFFYNLSLSHSGIAWVVIFLATVLIWLMCLGYIFLVLSRKKKIITDLVSGILGAGLFYLTLLMINFFWFRPRPFVTWHLTPLVGMSSLNSSFPSGHAGLSWLLAYLLAKHQPRLKWLFYFLAFLVSWARVAAGVHYLSDIIGGAILGIVSGYLACLINNKLDKSVIR